MQAVQTIEFWIFIFAMACGMGSRLATSNNLSQIRESLGYNDEETNTVLSLWSIWNFLGRFGACYMSDMLLHSHGWPRPLFMTITLATLCIGHLVLASGLPGAPYAGSVLVGVSYGSQWSLMPTILAEIFGVRHMGTIFNTIAMAYPVESFIFSVRLIGSVYDKEATGDWGREHVHGEALLHAVIRHHGLHNVAGSLSASFLYLQTRDFYNRDILRAIRDVTSRRRNYGIRHT